LDQVVTSTVALTSGIAELRVRADNLATALEHERQDRLDDERARRR
jgi:hypothetical protein